MEMKQAEGFADIESVRTGLGGAEARPQATVGHCVVFLSHLGI